MYNTTIMLLLQKFFNEFKKKNNNNNNKIKIKIKI